MGILESFFSSFSSKVQEKATHYDVPEKELLRIDRMEGTVFESYCARLFIDSGYFGKCTVEKTKSSGDFGVDILIKCSDGTKWAIQCKRYSNNLGIGPVQEVYAGMSRYGALKAAVITNSHFTKNAIELAANTGVKLYDRENLKTIINTCRKNELSNLQATNSAIIAPKERLYYQDLPHVPYIDGMKEYVFMFALDLDQIALDTLRDDEVIVLHSEPFEKEEDAKHFAAAFSKKNYAESRVVEIRDTGYGRFTVIGYPHFYSVRSNYRPEEDFFEFANWA